jgi:hypothetical protein
MVITPMMPSTIMYCQPKTFMFRLQLNLNKKNEFTLQFAVSMNFLWLDEPMRCTLRTLIISWLLDISGTMV